MEDRPPDIQRFELVQLLTVLVGLIHGFAVRGAIEPIFSALIGITLTLLISRARKNWARWTLLVLIALGAGAIIVGSFFGITQEALSKVYPVLTAIVWILQAIALVLLFTPQSTNWLRSKPAST